MAPLIPSAKVTLSYPLYACDFDPIDSSKLVVGGGGGAGRSGVGNRITLLDTSKPTDIKEAGEIDLSKEEDNVTSLGVGIRHGQSTIVYAGVNSSPKDMAAGMNEHFRAFGIEQATLEKEKPGTGVSHSHKISELTRNSLFTSSPADKETYQRILRLSRPYPGEPQLGAIATGFAKKSNIVIFNTPSSLLSPPIKRGTIDLDKEAEDMDFIQTGENEVLFAYCDNHRVYTKKFGAKAANDEPNCVYITPGSESTEKPTVPSFRAMRFLTPEFLLMLTNIHGQSGVVLQILRLPSEGAGQARIAQSKRLPSDLSKATGLTVCNLTPPLTASAKQEYSQFVIALAGHDISIRLFKVDLQVEGNINLVTGIKPFRVLKHVHPLQITGIAFSQFTPPAHPVTASTPPQYLKLASVSVGNTVVVHTLPLFPVPLSVKRGQSTTPRYVVALPSEKALFGFGVVLSILVVLLGAILTQSVLEIRGGVAPYLGATNYIPAHWQEAIGKPYVVPSDYTHQLQTTIADADLLPSTAPTGESNLPPSGAQPDTLLLSDWFQKTKDDAAQGVIFLDSKADDLKAHLLPPPENPDSLPKGSKSWDDLKHEEKEGWKRKLKDAGHWAEEMGETIFKGVIFGELAGVVGAAVHG
ncbi:hypothetical protein PVAG01_02536 [Phlyctema vagabunda]|uniref:Guanine nucleotide-exchange factor SEC12 n=1 Tax=Phlyctema vagabunda TaxID=108571 RepID=A0ABR4PQY6_9HELO